MKIIIKLNLLLRYLIFSRFVFRLPSKKKILIYDNNNVKFFKNFLPSKDITILFTRGEQFNISVIIKNFFKFKFSKRDYYNSYIQHVEPKIMITFSDNDLTFLQLQKFSAKKVIVQNAWKTEYDDHLFRNIKKTKKKFKFNLDYVFVFNKYFGEKYKILTNCKYINIGSFKSNLIKIKKNKLYDILFISSWKNVEPNRKVTQDLTWEKFNYVQDSLIKYLGNFSKNNKKSFFIYGKSTLPRLIEKEYEYYNKLLKNCNWKFIVGNRDKSYNIIDNSKLNITLNSTLGYESFTRGTKTIFFSLRPKKKFLLSLKFGWPAKINNRGYFWTDSLDETYCDKMLFRVIGLNSTKWKKIQSKYNEKLMVSNPNNTKFRSFIKKTVYN